MRHGTDRATRSRPSVTGRPRHALLLVATLAAVPALVSACGSSSTSAPSSAVPKVTTTTTATATSSTSASTSGTTPYYEVRTGTVKGLGTVLVDGQGFTLYLFVPDKQSGSSTCYGNCASGWPPLRLPNGTTTPLAGPGVDKALLGTTARTDGGLQVTYNKWPLYTWVGDSEPGQATGQGINSLGGLWYVLSPSGQEITAKP